MGSKMWDAVEQIETFLSRVTYKDGYRFLFQRDDIGFFLQVECDRPDIFTKVMGTGHGGKAYIDIVNVTESQLARTLFGLIRSYEEHETREFFQVDGVSVFGPHILLDALLEAGGHTE